jgi:hypothetical protein
MKSSLPLKLAIFVLILFALVVTAMLLWKPVKVRYYTSRLQSDKIKVRQAYAKKLLEMGAREPVFRYYTDKYDPKSVEKRMAVVDELCAVGGKGKEVMKEIFRNWACGPTQQVKIPAGTLWPRNLIKVQIPSLWVDKYEVTNEKYYVFMLVTGYESQSDTWRYLRHWKDKKTPVGIELCPVQYVSFIDIITYAESVGMRLPSEHEWEYAAGAGSTGVYCFGDNISLLSEYAWYGERIGGPIGGRLHTVGQKRPNSWGLYDVHGNVWEYCGAMTVDGTQYLMGGSFYEEASKCQLHLTHKIPSNYKPDDTLGFRCVRDAK